MIVPIFVWIINADIDNDRRGKKRMTSLNVTVSGKGEKKGCTAIMTFPSFCEPANLTGGEMI
ncbi:unnamed protein product [Brugia pahangi]|uniref:Secreted protein n=1 Tax=Brugia pahangi TaxID=6280 RepID=A0A0N4TC13_BRUPA|nr:unnamed protein product [Brugia pahangi]